MHDVPISDSHGSRRFIYPELQSNFDVVMSQNATLSGELDALRESLTRLQSSANQALADLSEKEAELRIQKRERFECESKLYAAAAEHDRMKDEAHAAAARLLQVSQPPPRCFVAIDFCSARRRPRLNERGSARERRRQQVPAPCHLTFDHCNALCSVLRQELGLLRQQLEDMRVLKDQIEKNCIIEKEKTQRMSAALLQTEADSRDLSLRYQQLELKLTHAEAELDTLKRSEKDRSIQLQVDRARPLFPASLTSLLLRSERWLTCSSWATRCRSNWLPYISSRLRTRNSPPRQKSPSRALRRCSRTKA